MDITKELQVRMESMVRAMAKECQACPYQHSVRCDQCWRGVALHIQKDVDNSTFNPLVDAPPHLETMLLSALHEKMYRRVSEVADELKVDVRRVKALLPELFEEGMIEEKNGWIRRRVA